jgi:hypothetical protein
MSLIADRTDAKRPSWALLAVWPVRGAFGLVVLGKGKVFAGASQVKGRSGFFLRDLARFESGEPLLDVRDEVGLADLAIVDDVDTRLHLLTDDLANGGWKLMLECSLVDLVPRELRLQHWQHTFWPRQAAHVGREDAVRAALHYGSS